MEESNFLIFPEHLDSQKSFLFFHSDDMVNSKRVGLLGVACVQEGAESACTF